MDDDEEKTPTGWHPPRAPKSLSPRELDHVERMRSETPDPFRMLYRLSRDMARIAEDNDSGNREREEQLAAAITAQEKTIAGLVRDVSFARRVAAFALSLAIPAMGVVFWKVLDRKEAEGADAVRLRNAEEEIRRLRDDRQPHWLTPPTPLKDAP